MPLQKNLTLKNELRNISSTQPWRRSRSPREWPEDLRRVQGPGDPCRGGLPCSTQPPPTHRVLSLPHPVLEPLLCSTHGVGQNPPSPRSPHCQYTVSGPQCVPWDKGHWESVDCQGVNQGIFHYNDVIMGAIASQITSLTSVYSIGYSDADQRKHQSSASLAFVWGIHRGPVNSPHKWPVTRKMFPFDDITMFYTLFYTFTRPPVHKTGIESYMIKKFCLSVLLSLFVFPSHVQLWEDLTFSLLLAGTRCFDAMRRYDFRFITTVMP